MEKHSYGFGKTVSLPFATAVQQVREGLQAQGFGVLCEIDVAAKIREKLGADFPPYLILGACNPRLAHQALQAEPDLGLLLPCNVIVRQEAGGTVRVMAMDPEAVLEIIGKPQVREIAAEVKMLLQKVLTDL